MPKKPAPAAAEQSAAPAVDPQKQYLMDQFGNLMEQVGDGFGGPLQEELVSRLEQTIADFHEEVIVDQSGRHNYQLIHKTWTLTGLTAGTSYTYYVGVLSSSTSGTPNIKWGGNGSDKYPDFIMKATALPATITT